MANLLPETLASIDEAVKACRRDGAPKWKFFTQVSDAAFQHMKAAENGAVTRLIGLRWSVPVPCPADAAALDLAIEAVYDRRLAYAQSARDEFLARVERVNALTDAGLMLEVAA